MSAMDEESAMAENGQMAEPTLDEILSVVGDLEIARRRLGVRATRVEGLLRQMSIERAQDQLVAAERREQAIRCTLDLAEDKKGDVVDELQQFVDWCATAELPLTYKAYQEARDGSA